MGFDNEKNDKTNNTIGATANGYIHRVKNLQEEKKTKKMVKISYKPINTTNIVVQLVLGEHLFGPVDLYELKDRWIFEMPLSKVGEMDFQMISNNNSPLGFFLVLPDYLLEILYTKRESQLSQKDIKLLGDYIIPHYDWVAKVKNGNTDEWEKVSRIWFVLAYQFSDLFWDTDYYLQAQNLGEDLPIGRELWEALPVRARMEILDLYEL